MIATRHARYHSLMLFFSLTILFLLFSGFHCAIAETPGQLETDPTTTVSHPVSAGTTTPQDASSPAVPQEPETGQASVPPEQTKTAVQFGPQADPCFTAHVAGYNWLDQVHDFVQDNTCEPAVWFDTFFVKDHVLVDLRPGMLIVLRNSAVWIEAHNVVYVRDFHFEWELPQWEKKLKKWKIYFDSRTVTDRGATQPGQPSTPSLPILPSQPGQPVEPGVDPVTGLKKPTLGVRLDFIAWLRSLVSIDTGIKVGLHPDAHARMRYQYTLPFGEVYLFRFSQIAMYQVIEHFTDTTQLDLERKFTKFTFVRWANNVTYTEGKAGITWNTGISLFNQLTPKSAISYDTSMWGVNYPDWVIQNYRVGTHYRRNFYRSWLFFELTPEVTWPRDIHRQRNSTWALTATLEIQFGK